MNESDTPRTDKEVRNRGERFKLAALQAVSADFARTLERRCAELEAGWLAACAFIDSHAADPDITPEMAANYLEFVERRAALDAARKAK